MMEKKIIWQEESREFVEMLKKLSENEKVQVKGIMIGLMMARQDQVSKAKNTVASA